MKIVLELDDRTWWEIAGRAEKAGVKVPELVAKVLSGEEPAKPISKRQIRLNKRTSLEKQFVELYEQGLHDGEISISLNKTRQWVANTRRNLGLEPNSPYKKKAEK